MISARGKWRLRPVVAAAVFVASCSSSDSSTPTAEEPSASAPIATTTSFPVESATTSTSPSTTTAASTPATTGLNPATTTLDGSTPNALALIDLERSSLAGWPLDADVDLQALFTDRLGKPTMETDWLPTPPKLSCTGNLFYRGVNWGDVRIVIERQDAHGPGRVEAWSIGLADPGIAPARESFDLTPPSGITTKQNIGIGDPVADIDIQNMFGQGDESTYFVAGARVIRIETDSDGNIVGFASGRNDCLGERLSNVACDRPVPIYTLPSGEPTGHARVDDEFAVWDDNAASALPILEKLGGLTPDDSITQLATRVLSGDGISTVKGPLRLAVVPVADPPVGQVQLILFDDRTDCIRQFFIGTDANGLGLDVGELQSYANTIVDEWYQPL